MTLGKKDVPETMRQRMHSTAPTPSRLERTAKSLSSDGDIQFAASSSSRKTGKFVRIIGGVKGSGPGELSVPHAVALDAEGRILVADSSNKRISVFGPDGKFVEGWRAAGQGGMAVGSDGIVYISDVYAGTIVLLKDGKIVDAIHATGRPHAMSLDVATNEIYVASTEPGKPNVIKIARKKAASK